MIRAAALGLAVGLGLASQASAAGSPGTFRFVSIDGGTLDIGALDGPVLVVNTASRCGFVGQFDGLQALQDRFGDRGLTVVGVPSNSFRQELRTEAAVKEFCEMNFAIDFPMTELTDVTGADAHPFYLWAQEQGVAPGWNFTKILLDGDGGIVGSWGATVTPDSPELVAAIEAQLE